jgi:DNA-binding XRE family transcriptional regulator
LKFFYLRELMRRQQRLLAKYSEAVRIALKVSLVFLCPGATIHFTFWLLLFGGGRVMTMFGDVLRELRTKAGLSQATLAQVSGLTTTAVYAMERGSCSPTLGSAKRLANALRVSLSVFDSACLPEDVRRRKREGNQS